MKTMRRAGLISLSKKQDSRYENMIGLVMIFGEVFKIFTRNLTVASRPQVWTGYENGSAGTNLKQSIFNPRVLRALLA